MSKIERFDGNLKAFAANSTGLNRTVFNGEAQSDTLDDNVNTSYHLGWEHVGPNEFPTLEDFNAMGFTLGQLIAYLHQAGVPEWNDKQEYHLHSIANVGGVLYKSISNDNLNHQPDTSPLKWKLAADPVNNASLTEAGAVQLNSSISSSNETQAATPKAVKTVNDALVQYISSVEAINNASITEIGVVQLDNSIDSTSQTTAATSLAVKQLNDAIQRLNSLVLVGAPIPWPSAVVPSGYLQYRGQSFDPIAFPQLAALYPTHSLIDMRGEIIRGWDDGRGVDFGRIMLSLQLGQNAEHDHTIPTNDMSGGGAPNQAHGGYDARYTATNGLRSTSNTTYNSGGNETRMRNLAFMYITRAA